MINNTEKKDTNISASENLIEQTAGIVPDIQIMIGDKGMSADVCITSTGSANEVLRLDDIKQKLSESNICFGIEENTIIDAVKRWQGSQQKWVIKNVAKGIPPSSKKEPTMVLQVKCIVSEKELVLAENATHCWELGTTAIPIQQVDKGDVIGRVGSESSTSGQNIFGEDIVAEGNGEVNSPIKTDENVTFDREKKSYVADITGLAYYVKGVCGVIPMSFDGLSTLTVSGDMLQASLMIHPAMEKGKPPSEGEIKKLIVEKSIVFGLDDALLNETFSQLNKGVYPQQPLLIARGRTPQDGKDGAIEFLFETETSLAPDSDQKGNVDYKNINIIRSVKTGDALARMIQPTDGENGKNVYGQNIPCKNGKPVPLPAGANTMVKPDDETILIAKIDGNVTLKNKFVEIYEGLVIKGSVSYATGNIEYQKSVIISEDVKSGFTIDCGEDLEIGGTIEDSHIKARGSILCRYGFTGQGKGLIESNGDVNIGFMKNQTIRCHGNVNIAKEALNCTIYAGKSINVMGRSLSIAGGTLIAKDSIICNVVGNPSGITTKLEVGLDFSLIEELEKFERLQEEMQKNKGKLNDTIRQFDNKLRFSKKLSPQEAAVYKKLTDTIAKCDAQIHVFEERKTALAKKMKDHNKSFIKVERSAMPGTVIKIGERNYTVDEEIIGPKTIRMVNFEIHVL